MYRIATRNFYNTRERYSTPRVTSGIEPALLPSAEGLNWRDNHSATEALLGYFKLRFRFSILLFSESLICIDSLIYFDHILNFLYYSRQKLSVLNIIYPAISKMLFLTDKLFKIMFANHIFLNPCLEFSPTSGREASIQEKSGGRTLKH